MNRRGFLKEAAASALSCAMLAACAQRYARLRYRLRVVVEIEGRQYEGASVVQTEFADYRGSYWRLPEMPEIESTSWGEAVIVDLREHGLLFGLLLHPDGAGAFNGKQPINALSRCLEPARRSVRENLLTDILALQGECELRQSDQPALVHFRNIADPSSVELVEPGRFSEVYGPDAGFVRATIAVTNDPVTEAIDRTLPWLAKLAAPGNTLVGKLPPGFRIASEMALPQRLTVRNFKLSGE